MDGQSTLTPEEVTEVERHKYFLSEKAGHDVGWEFAESDWRMHFGRVRISTPDSSTETSCETSNRVCDAESTESESDVQNRLGATAHASVAGGQSTPRTGNWLKRLFSKDAS